MKREDWPFDDPPNVTSFTTKKVLYEGHPILFVTHDNDGSWQFLCGTTNDPKDGSIVGLGCIYERDHSIGELADLPYGWCAWRESPKSPWHREINTHRDAD